MPLDLDGYENLLSAAVSHYWKSLDAQSSRQRSRDADRGRRAAVTGGKQMDGFCELFAWVLRRNGMDEASIYRRSALELPGFFRPTKRWDMLVVHGSDLIAVLEFKSHRGPSFGNNFNNRTEEALGNATDLWTAYRDGAYGSDRPRPWLGWLMLLEKHDKSTSPVEVREPHFDVFPEFRGTSYEQRYEILLRKLVRERHYNATALVMSTEEEGKQGKSAEPASDLGIRRMLASLAGHVASYEAGV